MVAIIDSLCFLLIEYLPWLFPVKTREQLESRILYRQVYKKYSNSFCVRLLDDDDEDKTYNNLIRLVGDILKDIEYEVSDDTPDDFLATLVRTVAGLLAQNNTFYLISPDEWDDDLVGRYTYRRYIREFSMMLDDADGGRHPLDAWNAVVTELLETFLNSFPHDVFRNAESAPLGHVPITQHIDDLVTLVDDLITTIYMDKHSLLFGTTASRLEDNLVYAASLQQRSTPKHYLWPKDLAGQQREFNIVDLYLRNTPLLGLFELELPITMPQETRFSHHWIIAPQGTGKTTALQSLIKNDLDLVAQGKASLIVMESNRDLITSIQGLKRFGKGGDLEGKLVVVDVEDVEYPIALNLFDLGLDAFEHLPARDLQALQAAARSTLSYIFRSLLGAALTPKQNTMFAFVTQLLMRIPDATLDTFVELMQPNGTANYQSYIAQLGPDGQQYFHIKFDSDKNLQDTKSQVLDRIFGIKTIDALAKMFAAPKTKLDLYHEMGSAKVILINAFNQLLQEDGTEVFTRFFLAMVLLAAQKRALLPRAQRLPTFFYIDECQDVIRRDEKIGTMLDQARKLNVGMILAHQRLGQMRSHVLDGLHGTAIKFAARVEGQQGQRNALATSMHTSPEFISEQPTYHFAAYIRDQTPEAISLHIPFVDFNEMPRLDPDELNAIKQQMRERYAYQPEVPPPPPEPEDAPPPAAVTEDDDDDFGYR